MINQSQSISIYLCCFVAVINKPPLCLSEEWEKKVKMEVEQLSIHSYIHSSMCVCNMHVWCLQEVKKLEGRLEKVSSLVEWVNQEEALFKFQVSSFPLLDELKVGAAGEGVLVSVN